MARWLLLLVIPTLLEGQIIPTRISGIPCEQAGPDFPTPGRVDSLRQRDPRADADSAVAQGEHRLWAFNDGTIIPGTPASIDWWADSLPSPPAVPASVAETLAVRAMEHLLRSREALSQQPGIRVFANTGHLVVSCTRRAPDGTLVTDRSHELWVAAATAYASAYNREVLHLLEARGR